MDNVSIYVATHKPIYLEKMKLDNCYKQIRVGSYAAGDSPGLSDNTGDNISAKNANYCELTALYWIWKNDKESDIVGLCHYRRYLTKSPISLHSKYFLTAEDICNVLQQYDVIAPKKIYYSEGIYQNYFQSNKGFEKDLKMAQTGIKSLYPDYLPYFQSKIVDACAGYFANVIIMRKPLFNEYCRWLFDILAFVEERTDLIGYNKEQSRIYGYLSERLLNVWIAKNNLRVKEFRMVNTEQRTSARYYLAETLKSVGILQLFRSAIYKLHKHLDNFAVSKRG